MADVHDAMMESEALSAVYKTHHEADGRIMSERVQSLASSIYKEFEQMIKRYDEDVVKELMPLVVGILETLDTSFSEKQENEVELELIKEDNEQLLAQYDREKQMRRTAEQKLLEIEDTLEEDKKQTDSKIESLESLVRMLELKSKNAIDHGNRLEEKESEMKKEYGKLHDRYTELFKTHMDYLERTKPLLMNERGDHASGGSRMKTSGTPALRPVHVHQTVHVTETVHHPAPVPGAAVPVVVHGTDLHTEVINKIKSDDTDATSIEQIESQVVNDNTAKIEAQSNDAQNHVEVVCSKTDEPAQDVNNAETNDETEVRDSSGSTEAKLRETMAKIVESTPELEEFDDGSFGSSLGTGAAHSRPRKSTDDGASESILDELNYEGCDFINDIDEGAELSGMGKEFDNLILENAELLATKNALNVVKDDLIAQVDELNSEVEMVKGEVRSLRALCDRYKERISELEDQVKKCEDKMKGQKNDDDDEVPRAQRKRFTRVEMARVLMERNQYKERLMELQEAVRWTEMIRASKEHPDLTAADEKSKSKSGVWGFFSNLFGDGSTGSADSQKPKSVRTYSEAKYTKGPGLPKHI